MEKIKEDDIQMSKSKITLLKKEKEQDIFFKGYRPNFYLRTDERTIEKSLSDSILESVRKVIEDDKAR